MITLPEGQTRSLCLHSLPAAQPHQEGCRNQGSSSNVVSLRRTLILDASISIFDQGNDSANFARSQRSAIEFWHVSSDFATAENGDRQFAAAFDEPAKKHKKRCTAGTFRQVGASRILVVWSIES
jgi:hypothetical protein